MYRSYEISGSNGIMDPSNTRPYLQMKWNHLCNWSLTNCRLFQICLEFNHRFIYGNYHNLAKMLQLLAIASFFLMFQYFITNMWKCPWYTIVPVGCVPLDIRKALGIISVLVVKQGSNNAHKHWCSTYHEKNNHDWINKTYLINQIFQPKARKHIK